MRAAKLSDLLNKGDRIAVSNITGREALKVSIISQKFCNNIIGGWALGKGNQDISISGGKDIPIFGQFEGLMNAFQDNKKPNKVVVYSPPTAVYGDVKEVLKHGKGYIDTIFVISENVSIEVTAKLRRLCDIDDIDIIGCNTLGMINAHKKERVGAVGGDTPQESFLLGSATIISNSGNMVNTISSYLQSAGLGVSYGISTGKDTLILTALKDLLLLAEKDRNTKIIVLYCEPGGLYEREAVEIMKKNKFKNPLLVYVSGSIAEGRNISLGHAGAVVEGEGTSASSKMELFDSYFGLQPFDPDNVQKAREDLRKTKKGIRVTTLHGLVPAAAALMSALNIECDFPAKRPLTLNPWLVDLKSQARKLPSRLLLHKGVIPAAYKVLIDKHIKSSLGRSGNRQSMRNASHASSNDGAIPRIYGYSLIELMQKHTFTYAVLLYWLGHKPKHAFEEQLFEKALIASLTNGPGTISAQGAKLSASAGNEPHTAMMTTLGSMGLTHGGNGKKAAKLLIDVFGRSGIVDPYSQKNSKKLDEMVDEFVTHFKRRKALAKDAGTDYEKVPCLGHPVFNKDLINYDPRERVISEFLEKKQSYNVFLDFYHKLTVAIMKKGATNKTHAVNVDAAITCICMGIAWPFLVEKKITIERVLDLPLLTFALGRVAGGAGEFLDHRESGTAMDMRIPVSECKFLGREKS